MIIGQGGLADDSFDSPPEIIHALRRAVLDITGTTDLFDVIQDVPQVMRVERHDLRLSWQVSCHILDVPEGRGAHVTKPLGQDQVRVRGAKGKDVDLVKGARRSEPFPNPAAPPAAPIRPGRAGAQKEKGVGGYRAVFTN